MNEEIIEEILSDLYQIEKRIESIKYYLKGERK